jgi:predicted nucleotidyltransferase
LSTPQARRAEQHLTDLAHPAGAEQEPAVQDESFEAQDVDEAVFLRVLVETVSSLEEAEIPHLWVGGIASSVLGRPRYTHDADLFVFPHDAERTLAALAGAGFRTQETDPHWLYKGMKDGVLIDVIFQSSGGIYLDDDMLDRAVAAEFKGVALRLAAPEDLLVMKAAAHSEQAPRYWHDALSIVSRPDLDWPYLMRRARHATRRVLSLLVYAQSRDLAVPDAAIRVLFEEVYGSRSEGGEAWEQETESPRST